MSMIPKKGDQARMVVLSWRASTATQLRSSVSVSMTMSVTR